MKNFRFILFTIGLIFAIQTPLKAQETVSADHELNIGLSYYSNLNSKVADGTFATCTADYRFSKLWGAQLTFGTTNNWPDNDLFAYTVSAGICAYPDFNSRFSLIPSIALGISGGAIAGIPDKNVGFMSELGVLAKYDVTDYLYCGFDMRGMFCRDNTSLFLAGFRIGASLKW